MSGVFLTTPSIRKLTCILIDVAVILASVVVAGIVRFGGTAAAAAHLGGLRWQMTVLTFCLMLCLYYNQLYSDRLPRGRKDLLVWIVKSFLAGGVLLSLLYYAVPALAVGRGILLIHFPLSMSAIYFWRSIYYWDLLRDSLTENVLVLGTGPAAKDIARHILDRKDDGYRIVGFLADDPALVGKQLVNPTVIGTIDQLPSLSQQLGVDTVVVALEDRRGKLPLPELLRCKLDGRRVEEAASFYELLTGQIPVRTLYPSWLIFSEGFQGSRFFHGSRRVIEVALAVLSLIVSLPILVISSLLVLLESGRPVLYRQERVGQRGRVFTLYKLRTMRRDAEKNTGAVWASAEKDPRITRIGKALRKCRMDELPQLFNILKGDMSFVGPRPERPCFAEQLRELIPYYDERHCIKPGLTGWAQVRFGYGSSVEEAETKLRYDLYYIKHMSLWLDLVILLDTAKVVVVGKGAR